MEKFNVCQTEEQLSDKISDLDHQTRVATKPADTRDANSAANGFALQAVEPISLRLRHITLTAATPARRSFHHLVYKWRLRKFPSASSEENGASSHCYARDQEVDYIVNNISADLHSGTLTAILGSSGSGKTTLLDVLAGRTKNSRGSGTCCSGAKDFVPVQDYYHGGKTGTEGRAHYASSETSNSRVNFAYVTQQDILLPTLTVRETLRYAADLRLPGSGVEERRKIVEQIILELGLKDAADTRIGNSTKKGCSSGEKRRASIGIQLLANPSVIFLDEPTTGLDASTAYQMVVTLKNLAMKGRNVVLTIHQPRSEIWKLFDNVLLLAKGCTAYCGPSDRCIPYFESLGYPLPAFVNPAEHVVDLVAIDSRNEKLEEESSLRISYFVNEWAKVSSPIYGKDEKTSQDHTTGMVTLKTKPKGFFIFFDEVWIQAQRDSKVAIRDPLGILASIFEAFSMSILTGWIFFNLGEDDAGIQSRQGALYTAAVMQGYLVLQYETYRLTSDIQIFDREKEAGVVGVSSFLIGRRLSRLLLEDLLVPTIFSVIFYHMVGFRIQSEQFLVFSGIILLEHYLAVCFAMLSVALSRNFAGASLIGNLSYTIQTLACGYFVNPKTIPVYVSWTKWASYLYYAYSALSINEFSGNHYDCPEVGKETNSKCRYYDGDVILESVGIQSEWTVEPIFALVGFVIVIYAAAGIILRFRTQKIKLQKTITRKERNTFPISQFMGQVKTEYRTVTIDLHNVEVGVQSRSRRFRWNESIDIIKALNASFEPRVLNVIMGPSGSGKTSLLQSVSRRIKGDFWTRYTSSGHVLFNGAVPSDETVRSICAYVGKDDDALLPSLTVRETLRFAAGLRLPSYMTGEEKQNRADLMLHQLGLKDCADTLVGSEYIKGISGGEKRRVSIGAQILTNPSVILLDEPTSGLDAFSTHSVIDVLLRLAQEGRTIIMSLHQSRSDLFSCFGNILLLAREGYSVYAGPANQMVDYFATQGHICPIDTNPADFALDLITVDLQCEDREAHSRQRVCNLIDKWSNEHCGEQEKPKATLGMAAELSNFQRNTADFCTAFPLLTKRAMTSYQRQLSVLNARLLQMVGFAIIVTLFFAPLRNDYAGIQNRLGLIHETAPAYFVGLLANVAVFPGERTTFYREYDDHAYHVEAFLMQYTTMEVPFELVSSLVFAVFIDLAVGLPRTAEMFAIVAYNCFCLLNCGESVGIVFNTFFSHVGFAVNVTAAILTLSKIMGGIMSIDMPPILEGCNYLSPVKYAFASLAPPMLRGQDFSCGVDDAARLADGACPIKTGAEVLRLYDLDGDPGASLLALGLCTLAYRLLAYLVLKCNREGWKMWRFGR